MFGVAAGRFEGTSTKEGGSDDEREVVDCEPHSSGTHQYVKSERVIYPPLARMHAYCFPVASQTFQAPASVTLVTSHLRLMSVITSEIGII